MVLFRLNDRPGSLSSVRDGTGPVTEAGALHRNLLWRKPGRVISTPIPELTQAPPCMVAPLGTDIPSLAAASTGPTHPLNHYERPPDTGMVSALTQSQHRGLLSCFPTQTPASFIQTARNPLTTPSMSSTGLGAPGDRSHSASTGLAGKSSLSPDIWKYLPTRPWIANPAGLPVPAFLVLS